MRAFLVAIVTVVIGIPSFGQSPRPEAAAPKTKIEAFEAHVGSVIIRGFSSIGDVSGQFGTSVSVESREYTNASNGKKEYGVLITVSEGGRVERENSSHIDYDEIESLLRGIDYVVKIKDDVTRMQGFQADYRTKDELVVSTYSSQSGIQAAVRSGTIGGVRAFLTLLDLQKFRELLEIAKANIESVRAAA
jgi:hypothetical protein